jgi:hypothetical protein
MRRPAVFWLSLCAASLGAVALGTSPGAGADDPPTPDFEFYKEKVSPIVHETCAQCHANPRKRLGKHFLRPVFGRTVRERDHRSNYETILGLIEPGNPAGSLWLLKPLGPGQGGVTHRGGVQVRLDSLEYGAMVDFINGAKLDAQAFQVPRTQPGQPDFRLYVARVEPVVQARCVECHAGAGRGRYKGLHVAQRGSELTTEQRFRNFEAAVANVAPGEPSKSRFVMKPLAVEDGGSRSTCAGHLEKADPAYAAFVDFVNGVAGPPPAERRPSDGGPPLLETSLVLQAEEMERDGDLEALEVEGAQGGKVVAARSEAARVYRTLRVPESGDFAVSLRVLGGEGPVSFGFDGGTPWVLDPPADAPAGGFADLAPSSVLDGSTPLRDAEGALSLEGQRLRMDGRGGAASWLSPADVEHDAVRALVALPSEEDGADDAFLLFDMADGGNGKLVGLTDGGRRFVMGVIEGGVPRILATARAPERPAPGTTREIRADALEGVAVGRLDGHALLFVNLDRRLGQGAFGFLTHGVATVEKVAAIQQFEVHKTAFSRRPVVHVPEGRRTVWVELPLGGASLDSITFSLSSP